MMTSSTAPISEADYDAIECALHSTEKGRRFLHAYVKRNRSFESLRLLRSISRLHKAALGTPSVHSEVSRDLSTMLKYIGRSRQQGSECATESARSEVFNRGFEEIEAFLIALIESLDEKASESTDQVSQSKLQTGAGLHSQDRSAKLFGELTSFFSTEQR